MRHSKRQVRLLVRTDHAASSGSGASTRGIAGRTSWRQDAWRAIGFAWQRDAYKVIRLVWQRGVCQTMAHPSKNDAPARCRDFFNRQDGYPKAEPYRHIRATRKSSDSCSAKQIAHRKTERTVNCALPVSAYQHACPAQACSQSRSSWQAVRSQSSSSTVSKTAVP